MIAEALDTGGQPVGVGRLMVEAKEVFEKRELLTR